MGNTCNELLEYCLRGEQWPDELLGRALAIDKAALGPSHPQTLRDVRKLSSLLRELRPKKCSLSEASAVVNI